MTQQSSRAWELRKYLEDRDSKGSRKRRWQFRTLMCWFGFESKRMNRVAAERLHEEIQGVGIQAHPPFTDLKSIKERVNLTLLAKPALTSPTPKRPSSVQKRTPPRESFASPVSCGATSTPQSVPVSSLAPDSDALLLGGILARGDRKQTDSGSCRLPLQDLLTHTFICGTTGSGKTVNLKILIEEAALKGIPAILVDLKGDLTSLAIPLMEMNRENLLPWVEAPPGIGKAEEATREAARFMENWTGQGYGSEAFKKFQDEVEFGIYTPRSRRGTHQMGVSFVATPPADWEELYLNDTEIVRGIIRDSCMALLSRIYPKIEKVTLEMGFLEELILTAWRKGLSLQGRSGVQTLVSLIQDPPEELSVIGAMGLDDYLSPQKRMDLASRINSLLVGSNSVWFGGVSADDIEAILESEPGKTKVAIVNMAELDFYDRAYVLSQLGYGLFRWARKMGGTGFPRVLFAIDEIGGGGGKEAFFPPLPYVSVSKPALNLLLRQGRAFGICCVFASQNPGDIDYRGLSNCQTWIIGKLRTTRDRDKIRQGISDAEVDLGDVDEAITSVNQGEFVIHKKSGGVEYFRQRWLLTFHKALSSTEVERLGSSLRKSP